MCASALTSLDLSTTKFYPEDDSSSEFDYDSAEDEDRTPCSATLEAFVSCLRLNTSLRHVDLEGLWITNTAGALLAGVLAGNPRLERLSLGHKHTTYDFIREEMMAKIAVDLASALSRWPRSPAFELLGSLDLGLVRAACVRRALDPALPDEVVASLPRLRPLDDDDERLDEDEWDYHDGIDDRYTCINIHTYLHTYIHLRIYTHICTHTHTHTHTDRETAHFVARAHAEAAGRILLGYFCLQQRKVCVCVCVCVCLYVCFVCVCVCACVCVCVHARTDIHTGDGLCLRAAPKARRSESRVDSDRWAPCHDNKTRHIPQKCASFRNQICSKCAIQRRVWRKHMRLI